MKFHYKMPSPIGFQLAPMLDIVFLLLPPERKENEFAMESGVDA